MEDSNRVKNVCGNWYVETRTSYDGPFENKQEASQFLRLLKSTEAARCEFAGLQFTPYD